MGPRGAVSWEPIDGDPDSLVRCSDHYRAVAQAVVETVANLRAATDVVDTASDAVAAFSDVAAEVVTRLDEVDDRYSTAAEQLAAYAGQLRSIQEQSEGVIAAAEAARADEYELSYLLDQARHDLGPRGSQGVDSGEVLAQIEYLIARRDEASQVAFQRSAEWEALLDARRDAAEVCATALREAVDGSSLNDGFWDTFVEWVMVTLPAIEFVLDVIAIVCTVLAFLAVLTGVGVALAPALFALARVAQFAAKIIRVVRVALTTALVIAGRVPPAALAQIAVDIAFDKVAGKVTDAAGKFVADGASGRLTALTAKLKSWAPDSAAAHHLAEIVDGGFDQWVNGTFADAANLEGAIILPDGSSVSYEEAFTDFLSTGDGVIGLIEAVGGVGDHSSLSAGLDAVTGDHLLSGDAWSVATLTADIVGWPPESWRSAPDLVEGLLDGTSRQGLPSAAEVVAAR